MDLIEYLQMHLNDDCDAIKVGIEEIPIIIKALEKQIAKKPIHEYEDSIPTCPTCFHDNITVETLDGFEGVLYCPDCGQKIDWQ